MPYDLGDTVGLSITVKDVAGAPVNAGTVTATITLPDQTTTAPAVANPPASTGIYILDYVPAQAGRHLVRWVTTTPNTAYVDQFDVRTAAPGYIVSLADTKRHLNITSTTDDEKLRAYIEAATEVIEDHVDRAIVVRTFAEVHGGGNTVVLHRAPVISLTTLDPVLSGGVSYLPADVALAPLTGMFSLASGADLQGPLRVTYVAGMPVTPANYTLAAHMIIQHLWQTQRGAGIGSASGLSLEGESEFLTGSGFAIPHRALELLGDAVPGIA